MTLLFRILLLLGMLFPAGVFADGSKEHFLETIRATLSSEMRAVLDTHVSASLGQETNMALDVKTHLQQNAAKDLWGKEDLSFSFSTPDEGSGEVATSVFFHQWYAEKKISLAIGEMTGSFDENAEELEGVFEILKVFSGNILEIDFSEISALFPWMSTSWSDRFFISSEKTLYITDLLLSSGVLVMTETPEGFSLVLNTDEKQWKAEVIDLLCLELFEENPLLAHLPRHLFQEWGKNFIGAIDLTIYLGEEDGKITSSVTTFAFSARELGIPDPFSELMIEGSSSFVSSVEPAPSVDPERFTPLSLHKILRLLTSEFSASDDEAWLVEQEFDDSSSDDIEEPNIGLPRGITSPRREKTFRF